MRILVSARLQATAAPDAPAPMIRTSTGSFIAMSQNSLFRHSGMVRQHQTRNLEIPGSMLRIAPE